MNTIKGPFNTDEKITPVNDVTHYNNFYEFGSDKGDPARNAQNFTTSPWTVSVEGEVAKPRKFTMDEILKLAPLEERDLPASLRGSLVDRGALDRLFAEYADQASGADSESQVRRLRKLLRFKQMPLLARHGNRVSVCGRAAAG